MNAMFKVMGMLLCSLVVLGGCTVEYNTTPQEEVTVNQEQFPVGTAVLANWSEGQSWWKGSVAAVNANGTYDIDFADGTSEKGLTLDSIAPMPSGDAQEVKVGDIVVAKWTDDVWWDAQITAINAGGNLDILYADDTTGSITTRDVVRPAGPRTVKMPEVTPPATTTTTETTATVDGEFAVGDEVVANWLNGSVWYPATITAVAANGAVDVVFYDNMTEEGLPATRVVAAPSGAASVVVGDEVVVKWMGNSWYRATVDSITGSNAAVTYSDGDTGTVALTDMVKYTK